MASTLLWPGSRRVLVVDDDINRAYPLADLIEALGHQCWVVRDGYSAVNRAFHVQADLVLVATELPLMCGFEVCQRLRKNSQGRPVQIVAMSVSGDDEERREAESCGFDELIIKPVDGKVLGRLLQRNGIEERRQAA
ncbi:MAG TPA: response regulator [Ideonella sp.]|uniref:response regulator n=1 Tax=Ideonella sp. TaxID=1929293 RepID=UPI002E2FB6BD|nr:response regulator [Ideonella sp.]HEX5688195.1 response regulator [Ideonella sp.]